MTDWTDIPDTTFEPGSPAKGRDMRFLRDNPIAIAEGAPGAPRMQAAGLATGSNERNWVLSRIATASVGAVGTYALLITEEVFGPLPSSDPGSTFSGSSLRYASASGGSPIAPSGTWRLMGFLTAISSGNSSNSGRTSVWLRVS